MVCCNPVLDKFEKCLGLCNNLFRFGLCSHERTLVLNDISFAPAGFKGIERPHSQGPKRKSRHVERQTMMSRRSRKPIPGASISNPSR